MQALRSRQSTKLVMNRLPLSTIFFYRFLSTVTQSKRSSIGFLGLGAMGYPMAMNVLKNHQIKNNETGADHQTEIFVLDIAPDRSDQLIQEFYSQNKDLKIKISIKSTNSIVDLASKCNIIITMLPNTDHVLETITGLNGILRNTKKGTLIIDCSTIDPTTSKNISKLARDDFGCDFLDCPVSGGVAGATAGTLTFMVGGSEEGFEKVKPILQLMGKKYVLCGEAGSGGIAKLCNNLSLAISMIGTSEALNLGVKLGMNSTKLSEVMNLSTARCWSSEVNNPVPGVMPNVPASRGYSGGFGSALMLKDLNLAIDAGSSVNSSLPLGKSALELYALICKEGYSKQDFSSVYDFLSKHNK